MPLLVHQFKTDLRHNLSWLLVYWTGLVLIATLLPTSSLGQPLLALIFVLEIELAAFLVLHVVQSDPLTGATAFWKTRPISRLELVLCKTLFIVLLIALPYLAANVIHWVWLFQMRAEMLSHAILEMGLKIAFLGFLVATLAAHTAQARQFVVTFVVALTLFFLWTGLLGTTSFFHGATAISNPVNSTIAVYSLLAVCLPLSWALLVSPRFQNLSLAVMTVSLLAVAPIKATWASSTFPWAPPAIPQATNLTIAVLNPLEPLPQSTNSQLLWSHFEVRGFQNREFARARSIHGGFDAPNFRHIQISAVNIRPMVTFETQPAMLRALHAFFPSDTIWSGPQFVANVDPTLPTVGYVPQEPANPVGLIQGSVNLDVFELEMLIDFPVQQKKAAVSRHGERFEVVLCNCDSSGITFKITRTIPNLNATEAISKDDAFYQSESDSLYVLYHPGFKEAFVTAPIASFSHSNTPFGDSVEPRMIGFPFPALRSRLTGITPKAWLAEARLQLYRPTRTKQCTLPFRQENYPFVQTVSVAR